MDRMPVVIMMIGVCCGGNLVAVNTQHHGLKLCQSTVNERIYKLPETIKCDETLYEKWKVKLEKKNIKEYETDAKSLEIVERICTTHEDFWGTKTKNEVVRRKKIGKQLARELLQQHACINSDGGKRMIFFDLDFNCKYKWHKTIESKTVSCYFNNGKVLSSYGGHTRSDLVNFQSCDYKEGFCETVNDKYVMWKVDKGVDSEYLPVGEYEALKADNKVIIEKLAMVFRAPEESAKNKTWVDREFKLTRIVQAQTESPKPKSNNNTIEALTDELRSRFAYLKELMRSPKSKMTYICDVLNRITILEHTLANIDPSAYIQHKTGNPLITAKSAGDFIISWPCYEVTKFRWVADKTEECHMGIPVEYSLNDSDVYHFGYVNPRTHVIRSDSIEVDCYQKGSDVTFINGKLEIHTPHNEKVRLLNTSSYIPLEDIRAEGVGFQLNYLDTAWVYNSDELSYDDVTAQIVDHLTRRGEGERSQGEGSKKEYGGFQFLNLFGIFGGNVWAILFGILSVAEKAIIVVILYRWIRKKNVIGGRFRKVRFVDARETLT